MKPGQIVYGQGRWKCRVVEDFGESIAYVALEGAPSSYRGETLHAAKDLFATSRDRKWPSIITDPPEPA